MISITILTKNSEKHLEKVLASVEDFDEVLIYDTGSGDKTLEIAEKYPNAAIFEGPFEGFGKTHNQASNLCRNDWVLSLDSDEVLSPELKEEIFRLKLDPHSVYSFPRKNFYQGKWIKGCGWHPDRVVRLYHRKWTKFTDREVHEKVEADGLKHYQLKEPVFHYPYSGIKDFLAKMQFYTELFAEEYQGKRKSSFPKALGRAAFSFFKSYILKKGFLLGKEGFIISFYNGSTAFFKYIKLLEKNIQDSAMSR